jgi:hypothetical protein
VLVSVLLQIGVLHRNHVMLLLLFFVVHFHSFAVAVFLRDECRICNSVVKTENEQKFA